MQRGILASALALALAACPSPNGPSDGGAGGGDGSTGGGTAAGGGTAQGGGQNGGGTGGATHVSGDSCSNPIELDMQGGSFTVDTTTASDDYQGGCAYLDQKGGKELVYHVNVASTHSVTFTATGATNVDPVIYVRGPQCKGAALACADQTDVGGTEVIFLPSVHGDLYFFIDGWDPASSGEQMVTITFGAPVAPPPNDDCVGATPLVFTANRAMVSGDTSGAENSNALAADAGRPESPSCTATAALSGRDVIYSFTVPKDKNVAFSLTTPGDGGLDPAVYVRSACESTAAADELACNDGTFTLTRLDAGTYYVWVDGLNGSYGPFDLTATMSDYALAPPNDACANAEVISASGGTTTGTLVGAVSDIAATCGSGGAPDVAYVVTTTSPSDIVATVSTSDPLMQPVVFIRPGCSNGFEAACGYASAGGRAATATALGVPAGTWVIWVESLGALSAFTLGVQVTPSSGAPTNDLCTGAIAVANGVITGDTRAAKDDLTSAQCGAGGALTPGPDVFYRVTVAQGSQLEATVTPTLDGGAYRPSLYLRPLSACLPDGGVAATSGSPGCINGGSADAPVDLIVASLDAGTYLLVVDGLNGTKGAFDLSVNLGAVSAPPTNDTCAGATPLLFTNGVATVTATTRGAANDHQANTSGCLFGGPDLVYGFTTPDGGRLDGGTFNAKVVAWSNNALDDNPSVYLQSGCGPDAGLIACDDSRGAPFFQSRANAWGLKSNAPYTLWVDSPVGDPGGFFTVQLSIAGAPPSNDACPNATVLPLNSSLAGSTLGAGNHFSGNVAGDGGFYAGNSACGNLLPGADVVFQVTATVAGVYVARVEPERGFDVALGVTTACMRGACVDTVDAVTENLPETVTFTAAAGATYFIMVDSNSDVAGNGAARGGFVVSVQSP